MGVVCHVQVSCMLIIDSAHGAEQRLSRLPKLLITSYFPNFVEDFVVFILNTPANFLQFESVGLFLVIFMQLGYAPVVLQLPFQNFGLPVIYFLHFSEMLQVHFLPHFVPDDIVCIEAEGHNIFNIQPYIFIVFCPLARQLTYIMITYRSELHLDKDGRISLPKIKASIDLSQSPQRRISLANLTKEKMDAILRKQIKPPKELIQSSESDGQMILRKIQTPEKHRIRPEVAVLSLNQNKKQRVKNRFVKQVFIGQEAVQKFYDRYKHMEKYKEKQHYMKQNNVITQVVQLLDGHGFAPRKLDLIKLKGSHAILDLKTLGLGQGSMGSVVTELIGMMGHFEYVDLSSNRIDRTLSEDLVSQLGKVKIINLSHNRVGKIACDRLSQMFFQPKTQIQELYLEDNNLMDNAGASLLKGLSDYNYLRVLDLSKNFMSNRFAQELKQFLSKDRSLEELYLGWNEFGDKSTKLIFEGLCQHTDLKVFDYSWNMIGFFSIPTLQKLLKQNQSLLHLDISFCDIDKKNSAVIAKALETNHTIYGIHYQGNSGTIDHKGYLRLTEKEHKEYPLPIVKGLIRKIDSIHPNNVQNQFKSYQMRDVCWICDSWQEVYFNVKNTDPEVKQCYLHIRSEGFKSIKMETGQGYFETFRMLAMDEVEFFFTFNKGPGQKEHFVSADFPKKPLGADLQFGIGDIKVKTRLEQINYYKNEYVQDVIDENFFPNIHCVPRSQQVRVNYGQQQQARFKQVKKVLVKKKVIRQEKLKLKYRELDEAGAQQFLKDRNNRDDDRDFLLRCIEFDIANSKMCRLIKQPDDLYKFKLMMLDYYRDFKDGFYYLASSNPALNGIYSISEVVFQQFLEEQKYITKRVTLAKIMLKMYSCLSVGEQQTSTSPDKKTNQLNQKKGENIKLFCRPQFLQFLVRLALQKWCTAVPKPKKKKSTEKETKQEEEKDEQQQGGTKKQKLALPLPLIQGIERTIKTMSKYADRVRSSTWRKQKYLTIDIYTVIKGYQSFLGDIFGKYSQNKRKLDKPKKLKGFLTLEEFKSILIDADIKRTKQAAKDCEIPYLESKRLELEDGYLQFGLNYDQFCQCLARYSEILWFPPVACQKHELWEFEPNRRFVPLFIRLESLIVNLYRKHLQFHNRRMHKVAEFGLFLQESQILIQKIKQMDIGSNTDLAYKINSLEEEQITLRDLIDQLKYKYKDATVAREEEIEEEEDQIEN